MSESDKEELRRISDGLLEMPVRGADKREQMREWAYRLRALAHPASVKYDEVKRVD